MDRVGFKQDGSAGSLKENFRFQKGRQVCYLILRKRGNMIIFCYGKFGE